MKQMKAKTAWKIIAWYGVLAVAGVAVATVAWGNDGLGLGLEAALVGAVLLSFVLRYAVASPVERAKIRAEQNNGNHTWGDSRDNDSPARGMWDVTSRYSNMPGGVNDTSSSSSHNWD